MDKEFSLASTMISELKEDSEELEVELNILLQQLNDFRGKLRKI